MPSISATSDTVKPAALRSGTWSVRFLMSLTNSIPSNRAILSAARTPPSFASSTALLLFRLRRAISTSTVLGLTDPYLDRSSRTTDRTGRLVAAEPQALKEFHLFEHSFVFLRFFFHGLVQAKIGQRFPNN